MSEDLKGLVNAEDVAAAVKSLHGPQAALLHYKVEKATSSVQGFTSLMLRVTATVQVSPEETTSTSLIVKRLPLLEVQKEMAEKGELFPREVAYFRTAVPILEEKVPDLPLVKCFVAHDSTLIMEDLCASGFETLAKTVSDVGKTPLGLEYYRLIVRKLAIIHAASLDADWLKIIPKLQKDALFEGGDGELFTQMMTSGASTIVEIMNEMYPDLDPKYSKWLLSPELYETMTKLSKADPKYMNVLCHGDCWINNMMFKVDSETGPIDVKFIDLQIYRYAPNSRDILYLLYNCTNKKFREEFEEEILHTYVDAFNTVVCETPDRLPYDKFKEEYEKSRFIGVSICMVFRPMMLMEGFFPEEKEELSKEMFESMMQGNHGTAALKRFRENEDFRNEMKDIVDEVILSMDKTGLV